MIFKTNLLYSESLHYVRFKIVSPELNTLIPEFLSLVKEWLKSYLDISFKISSTALTAASGVEMLSSKLPFSAANKKKSQGARSGL
jgi:hypothetical protein